MGMVSVRTIIALLLIALPVCWGAVFAQDTMQETVQSLPHISEAGNIMLFGVALLTLASYMRVRGFR
jgi:hypothetical protein